MSRRTFTAAPLAALMAAALLMTLLTTAPGATAQEPNNLPTLTGPASVQHPENSAPVATYTLESSVDTPVQWSAAGLDGHLFNINDGQLRIPNTTSPLNFLDT